MIARRRTYETAFRALETTGLMAAGLTAAETGP